MANMIYALNKPARTSTGKWCDKVMYDTEKDHIEIGPGGRKEVNAIPILPDGSSVAWENGVVRAIVP